MTTEEPVNPDESAASMAQDPHEASPHADVEPNAVERGPGVVERSGGPAAEAAPAALDESMPVEEPVAVDEPMATDEPAAVEEDAVVEEPTYRVVDTTADAESAFEAAADAVAAGEVIVLPTDTVYGVGADPFSAASVQRLLDAKKRGRDMPPPVLVAEVDMVGSLAEVDDRVRALAAAYWPGALTLVLKAASSLQLDLGDRGDTIAVRVPAHDFTRELLRRTGPLAVTSANVSGSEAALVIDEAVAQLGNDVSVYLDAGEMSGPVPSTILDLSGDVPALLRAGRLSVDDLNTVVPGLLVVEPEHDEPLPDEALPDEAVPDDAEAAPGASEVVTSDQRTAPEASEVVASDQQTAPEASEPNAFGLPEADD